MIKKRVYIHSFGCVRRALDATRLRDYCVANGCEIVKGPEDADTILFTSCGFMKSTEDKSLELVERFSQYRGELVVMGCLPETSPERLRRRFDGAAISTKDIAEINQHFPEFAHKFADRPDANTLTYSTRHTARSIYSFLQQCTAPFQLQHPLKERQPPQDYARLLFSSGWEYLRDILLPNLGRHKIQPGYLRISNGCLDRCAYCSIQRAIGPLISKPLTQCIGEYKKLLGEGYRTFEFQADNLGAYGLDINSTFPELLRRLAESDQGLGARWAVKELHPKWAVRYRDQLLAHITAGKIFSLHCPIQSGSERILGLMNRYARAAEIESTLKQFRAANPKMALSTYIIAGFPTETEDEFLESVRMVQRVGFSGVFIFPYHEGENSPAAKIGPADEATSTRRLKIAQRAFGESKIVWRCP